MLNVAIVTDSVASIPEALIAGEMLLGALPDLRIEVIDTLNVAMCQGWMVIEAARAAEAEKLKQLFEARLTCVESLIAELSPALGVHTGPGTAGICYFPVRP